MCRYLNLRGSSFTVFDSHYLFQLEFIDVRDTKLDKLDLLRCSVLKMIVIDLH